MAKDRGLAGVYVVETLGAEREPRLLYHVSPDGKRELVRGAVLDDVDERALRSSIDAAGKDLWVANSFGDPPTTVLAPALLFSDATVQRQERQAAVLSAARLTEVAPAGPARVPRASGTVS
jgi:hypothetical protein